MSLAAVNFEIITPLDDGAIASNIAHALSLGIPEADSQKLRKLTIIANGPSAKDAPLDGETLALNGALKLFMNSGRIPTYWAACDPQALVADFLPDHPPQGVTYLVASKCHPSVFEKLKNNDVRLWHIDDHPIPPDFRTVACASSVTLCITQLMRKAFNYRTFDFWGWDACYDTPAPGVVMHHASEASLASYPPDTVDIFVGATQVGDGFEGGRKFKTSRTWAAEAQDAMVQLHFADYDVNIHGDGLIKAIRDANATKPRQQP